MEHLPYWLAGHKRSSKHEEENDQPCHDSLFHAGDTKQQLGQTGNSLGGEVSRSPPTVISHRDDRANSGKECEEGPPPHAVAGTDAEGKN